MFTEKFFNGLFFAMKLLLFGLFLLLNVASLRSQVGTAGCPNADFSMMSFTNWVGRTGTCCPINLPNTTIDPNRHVITTMGADQVIGALPTVPPGKSTAARLGNSGVGAQAEALSYTFWVNPMNALFMYEFAVVLEDAGHPATAQARFELQVRDQFGNVIPCTNYLVAASQNIPGFQSQGVVRWRPWTRVGVDLLAQMGQQVTIEARTGDCAWSGHYGYGYVFAECSPMQINVDYCVGDTMATMVAPAGFSSYVWRLQGNPTIISTSQTLVINNVNVGTNYECTITSVMGCSATLAAVLNPITPVPGFTTMNLCDGMLQFTDITVVPNSFVSQWNWNFGDGTTSTAQSPTHIYANSGTYNVTLIATAPAGCTDTVTLPVTVPPGIVASFGYNQGCGLTKTFTDMSTIGAPGQIVSWNWSFGDGASSTQQNPTHTYATPGVYNVQLLVGDADGCSKTTNQILFINANPVASFIAPQTCHGTATPFSNMTTLQGGNTMSHQWSFGNGQSSNVANPIVTYSQPGTYTVTLISTGPGSCSDTFSSTIVVVPSPQASFTLPPPCGLSQPITNTSSILPPGVISQYQWSFGNNSTSNLQNPSTNYTLPGTYNVSLIVTSADGCVSSVAQPYTVYAIPVAGYNAAQVCHGNPTPFNTTSTIVGPGPLTYSWNFGNGAASTAPSPAYTYPLPGTYNTSMVVTGPGGCTATASQTVLVPPTPVANFQIPPICGLVGVIQNTSTIGAPGVISTYTWNLDNGQVLTTQNAAYNYAAPGQYNVTLTVSTAQGCSHSITQLIQVQAVPQVSFNAPPSCHPLPITFTNNTTIQNSTVSSWNWSFGDGNTSNSVNPVHSYATHGSYNVTLIATAPGGCADTLTQQVLNPPAPVAGFSLPPACGLVNTFTNTTSILPPGQITNQLWTFGDGNSSTQGTPTHAYVNPGTYTVTLITYSNGGCNDTVSQQFTTYSVPVASFTAPQTCHGLPLQITDQSTLHASSITSWSWNFGDGNTSASQSPTHSYVTHGNYPITLIVVGPGGCSDTLTQQVLIPPTPVASFTLPGVCGMSSSFNNTSSISAPGQIVQNSWSFGDGATSGSLHSQHIYATNGTYNVTLTVTSDQNCTSTITQPHSKHFIPVAAFSSQNDCMGSPTPFSDLSTVQNDQITQWQWNLGDNNSQNSSQFNHSYVNYGVYTITLIVTSSNGCSDTSQQMVTIHPIPTPSFTAASVCRGLNSVFINGSSIPMGSIVSYQWDFGTSGVLASTQTNPSPVIVLPGTYQVTLTATSGFGCSNTYTAPVTVWPRPDVDFIAEPFEGCQPMPVQFSNLTSIGSGVISGYQWSLGDGSGSQSISPFHLYPDAGSYTISLTATSDMGCDSSITRVGYIVVHPKPVADFSYSPPFPTSVNPELFIEDLSIGASNWYYEFGDGRTYDVPTFFHNLPAEANFYYILQIVTNQFGCSDSTLKYVELTGDFTVFIPNSFSPNGDGLNDFFRIHGKGIVDAKMWVFDRWGEELVYLENLEPLLKGWDGLYKSERLKQDVYAFRAIIRDIFGKEHEYFGQVNLIR
jgi:gliding motility-associated-like protein